MAQATSKRCIYSALPMQVFMIHAIKNPLVSGLHILFEKGHKISIRRDALKQIRAAFHNMGKLPEPTMENTWHPNTHNLILLRTWAFGRYRFLTRFKNIVNFAIIIHAFDPPWRWMMETILRDALEMKWSGGIYWGWWNDVRNLIALRDNFIRRANLSQDRVNFIRRFFLAMIILHIICPPWRAIFKSTTVKVREMKWEDRMFGHNSVPNWEWWKEDAG